MFNKDAWIKGLKVGDIVCTCTTKHKQIVRLEDVKEPKNDVIAVTPMLLARIWLPLAQFAEAAFAGFETITVDRIAYFGDGTHCHAGACLDPVSGCLHA